MREPSSVGFEGNGIVSPPPQALLERLKDFGQEDAFALWYELSPEERDLLVKDIESLDLSRIDRIIRCSLRSQGLPSAAIEPVPENSVSTVEDRSQEDRERWWKMGLKAISDGKLAVLLLSGGQWSKTQRLGKCSGCQEVKNALRSERLRGQKCLESMAEHRGSESGTAAEAKKRSSRHIGLPSGKSLFQLQAERILCVQRLAAQATNENSASSVQVHWYIMTSPFTDEATRKFFESHKFFGLEAEQVTFFQQGTIPCVSKDGRFIMETPYRVAKAPDGNGGVYSALKSTKLLEDMASKGIKYIDCYGVDNALVRVADPTFLGYFIDKGVAAAAKVVRKAYPQEKVGVFVRRGKGGPLTVVEYSELESSLASAVNQATGHRGEELLRFDMIRYSLLANGNTPFVSYYFVPTLSSLCIHLVAITVCLHMFTLDFLNQVANGLEKDSIYHLAEKKIPSIHGYTVGLKLEQFIFDAFPYAPTTALFEVLREEEFAPVKNANGSNVDTPDSAKLLVLRLHTRWVVLKCHHSVRILVKTWNLYVEEEHFMHLVRSHSSSTVRSCGFAVTYTTMREFSVPYVLQY
ncbi:UDP-N-acetylglucosamine diphosphorylase [Vigna angularis]|uniref:UDP-N-acetylglucosamine diphosphorylase n=1 Tax=Phaseolus angularis TaxID=3914 RepID=A0A8T0LCI9_PHAAN|nr:UDP-N-acetylglucosamine diphosphorylase [Vigna angularis]